MFEDKNAESPIGFICWLLWLEPADRDRDGGPSTFPHTGNVFVQTSSIFHVQFFLKSLEISTTALPLYATASDIAIIDFGVVYSKNAELFGHSCYESYY